MALQGKILLVQKTADGIRRLRARIEPLANLVTVKNDLLVFCLDRVINADLVDRATITGLTGILHYDAVIRTTLASELLQSDLYAHAILLGTISP